MIEVTELEEATGKITGVFQASALEYIQANVKTGYQFIQGNFSGNDFYFVNSVLTERPSITLIVNKSAIAADGIDILTIAGLPSGNTSVDVTGPIKDSWTETNSTIELTANMPGRYMVALRQWPYKDAEIIFDAT